MDRAEADTIFAAASGTRRAGVQVVRISGPGSGRVLDRLCRSRPAARRASVRTLRGPDGVALDRAMVLWMPGPGSYTGEDCAELHLHGGQAVLDGVSDALVDLGARPAEAGEFTRRAFVHGRMDLVQAEAVADLVDAETTGQVRQALRQLDGGLSGLYAGWATRLTRLLAFQEALIDFADEDLPEETAGMVAADVAALTAEIGAHLADGRRGERLRTGLVFAVIGPPNVGKSSLINALSRSEAAIVADGPGTTRDPIEVRMVFGGVPVTLVDTAGLRAPADTVEAEGIRRARARAQAADLVVAVTQPGTEPVEAAPQAIRLLLVCNKMDLLGDPPAGAMGVSARTGAGLDDLREALATAARALTARSGPPPLTRVRHRAALEDVVAALHRAAAAPLPELRAEDLRLALRGIGRITGAVDAEALLDVVFSSFCIGK